MVSVKIAADFFFKDWHQNAGELWLVLRPHVRRKDFIAYANTAVTSDLSLNDFQLGGENRPPSTQPSPDDLIAVNLPTGIDIALRARRNGVLEDIRKNDRVNGARITSGDLAHNTASLPPAAGASLVKYKKPVDGGSFAKSYNDALKQQIAELASPSTEIDLVIQHTEHALTGGTLRNVETGFDQMDSKYLDMMWPTPAEENKRVNLHSLLGLTFRLGVAGDTNLGTVTDIEIDLTEAATGNTKTLIFTSAMGTTDFFKNFFTGIDTFAPVGAVAAEYFPILTRAYVKPASTLFTNQKVAGKHVFSLQNFHDDSIDPPALALKDLSRLTVRLGNLPRTDFSFDDNANDIRAAGDLNWTPHLALHGQLRRYRRAGTTLDGTKKLSLLQFVPSKRDRQQFQKVLTYLKTVKQTANALKATVFVDVGAADAKVLDPQPQPVGAYQFLWDNPGLSPAAMHDPVKPDDWQFTLLFWGELPPATTPPPPGANPMVAESGKPVMLLVPLLDEAANAATFVTPARGIAAGQLSQTDPLGPRWEAENVPFGVTVKDAPFNTLLLDKPSFSGSGEDLLNRFAVDAAFAMQLEFEPACSASRLEFILRSYYPPMTDPKAPITREGEYLDDQINYNALNVYRSWASVPEWPGAADDRWLNPQSEIYPVFCDNSVYPDGSKRAKDPARRNVYHVRFEEKRARLQDDIVGVDQIRKWTKSRYDENGQDRTLDVDLEHTFGPVFTTADLGLPTLKLPTVMDWPLQIASSIGCDLPSPGLPDQKTFFLSIALDGDGDTTKNESITFLFEQRFLTATLFADAERAAQNRQLCVAAWQSIAELANAQKITLLVDARRFDFVRALGEPGSAIYDGLEPASTYYPGVRKEYDVTSLLGVVAAKILKTGDLSPLSQPLRIDNIDDKDRLDTSANIVSFQLKVERKPDQVVSKTADLVSVVRTTNVADPATMPFSFDGRRTVRAPEAAVPYANWVDALQWSADSIAPAPKDGRLAKLLAGVIGGPRDWTWLRLNGAVAPTPKAVTPAIVPFGYRPVNLTLGAITDTILADCLDLIEFVINCSPRQWFQGGRTPADWDRLFHSFEATEIQDAYRLLVNAVSGLVAPLPAPWGNAPSDPQRPPEVAHALTVFTPGPASLTAPSGANSPERQNFIDQLALSLAGMPSLYGTDKALLYTRLATADGKPNPDFFDLTYERVPSVSAVAGIDRGAHMFREGIAGLAKTDCFGLLEHLDDKRYGNVFGLFDATPYSFEGFVEGLETPTAARQQTYRLPWTSNGIALPETYIQPSPAAPVALVVPPAREVHLASRQHVSDPVLLGQITWEGDNCPLLALQTGQIISGDALKNGYIQPSSKPGDLQIVAALNQSDAPLNVLDNALFAAAFAIFGDEEAGGTDWADQLVNDTFAVEVRGATAGRAIAPDVSAGAFFDDVLAAHSFDDLTVAPETVLTKAVMDSLTQAARPAALPDLPDGEQFFLVNDAPAGAHLEFRTRAAPGKARLLRAYILQRTDARGLILLLLAEAPIWAPCEIALTQERNTNWYKENPKQPLFAKDFWMASRTVRARAPLLTSYPRDAKFDAKLTLTGKSAAALVTELFGVVPDSPPNPDRFGYAGDAWRNCDLSVTVHRQLIRASLVATQADPNALAGPIPFNLSGDREDKLPVSSKRFSFDAKPVASPASPQEPFSYDQVFDLTHWVEGNAAGRPYVLEFQWYRPETNVGIARIHGYVMPS